MDHTRHIGIFTAKDWPVTLIGAGGIGAITAIVLAKMGIPVLNIYDDDTVDPENVATQFYGPSDIGQDKTYSLTKLIANFSDETIVYPNYLRVGRVGVEPKHLKNPIIISAVDSITARKVIWQNVLQTKWMWYLDARMSAEIFQLYAVNGISRIDPYNAMLMDLNEEDVLDEPCTSKATIYTGAMAAGHIGSAVRKIVSGQPVPFLMVHNIFENQILVP
jgi:hypothetical protein